MSNLDVLVIISFGITVMNMIGLLTVWMKYLQLAKYSIDTGQKILNEIQRSLFQKYCSKNELAIYETENLMSLLQNLKDR